MPFRSVQLHPAEVLAVHYFAAPAQRVLSRRVREPAQLIVISGGVYTAHVDNGQGRQTLVARAGDVVCWPASGVRTEQGDPDHPTRCISIYFRWPGAPAGMPLRVRDSNHVLDLLAARLLALAHDAPGKAGMGPRADAYLAAMLAEYLELAESESIDLVFRVQRYAEEHMRERVRLADLARHVGLEKHHFSRKYRQLTGRTAIRDVQRRKAAHAKHILLQVPGRTLADVAARVGVRDASKLSRLLARYAGTSVREIRRAARANR